MSCSVTLSGIARDCAANAGGIKAIYLAPIDDVSALTYDTNHNKISSITMVTVEQVAAKFHAFYFKKGQASLTSTPQFNEAGDYAGEQAVITVNFAKMDSTKRAQMAAISVAEMAVMVLDQNGIYWYYGVDNAVMRTGGDSTPGQATTDFNHYGIELTANDNQLAYEVDGTAAAAVIA